ncbi:Protein of unknown function [Loktanella sp. DSM 29012]|uniref:DUF1353 domain-containing protein n=1 Tax=Loktanella sp. DSM 29012 TaxID=1881056 RepID=UPI0008C62D6C|nr:DUF1353 domain-containing protein [Loktanella sp. DSM 29012]SEQ60035.1 Protein of unknown function [Loktanella sp. DSM 29012]
MSAYTDAKPIFSRLPRSNRYRTCLSFAWELGCRGSGLLIEIPEGYTFDVSVPPGLRLIFNPHDPKFLKAAALHDNLLERGWDRVTAAGPFHRALRADGVGPFKRLAMLLAVILWRWS